MLLFSLKMLNDFQIEKYNKIASKSVCFLKKISQKNITF